MTPKTGAPAVTLSEVDGIGYLKIDAPPVNAISAKVIQDLEAALEDAACRDLEGLVIHAAGRTFVAGGDIRVFDDPDFSPKRLNALLARIEAFERPVVAALHGTTLGGGLELAIACHARVAAPKTRFGLPEITLGLIPGSLGTQRLPRLVGLERAAEMILSGKPIGAQQALDAGLIDAIAADPVDKASELVRSLGGDLRRASQLPIPGADRAEAILAPHRDAANARPFDPASAAAVEVLTVSARDGYAAGAAAEARVFLDLIRSDTSRALRHMFFAERKARKIHDLPADIPLREVKSVGILGAGTMGSGIALAFANAGSPVTLVDVNPQALDRGLGHIAADFEKRVQKGRLSPDAAQKGQALISGAAEIAALANVDLVVEAVFEDMALKCDVIGQLGRVCKPGAILATNTSTLDVDRIAQASGRPSDVIGTHFFSPAQIMRLLEVVRGRVTAPDVLATVMEIAGRIRKTAVVTGVCYGFIGNRMAEVYMRESEAMQMEGATPAEIDGVAEDPGYLGMAMGPSRMLDMAGVDVGARTVIEWIDSGAGPQDPAYRALCRALFKAGRHGQKTGEGYYRYEGRTALPSDARSVLAKELAQEHGIAPRDHSPQEILERLLYPMVNEAALILEEGIAQRASDIDVIWTAGYGFPAWRGGPLFMADLIGVDTIVAAMTRLGKDLGNSDGRWTPAPLLQRLAQTGGRILDT
ncbi:enoyl-CoA hydratase [Thioclava sp. BHET1]|nr:enoyl-CoA hydratase [Thioclava sp. BHET1]